MGLERWESAYSIRDFGGFGDGQPSPWLVLGGGGLRGLAHIGACEALSEAGIRPEGIIGTSIGALIGALAASGMPPAEMRERSLALQREDILRVNRRAVWINGIRQLSVFRGDALRKHLADLLPEGGWDALDIPVLVNATDLGDGSTVWFGSGARTDQSLVDAVYASAALPVFYPPFQAGGRAFVDGGIGCSLPLEKAEEEGAARIIAIDVGSGEEADAEETLDGGMLTVHERVVSIMTWRRRRDLLAGWKGPPLLYVRPRLAGYGTFDFDNIGYFLDEGYRATRAALAGETSPR